MKVEEASNVKRFLASLEMTAYNAVFGRGMAASPPSPSHHTDNQCHFERSEKSQNALYSYN
jgi:hypothetical protein